MSGDESDDGRTTRKASTLTSEGGVVARTMKTTTKTTAKLSDDDDDEDECVLTASTKKFVMQDMKLATEAQFSPSNLFSFTCGLECFASHLSDKRRVHLLLAVWRSV